MGILLSIFEWILFSSITASFLAVMIIILKLLLKDRFGVRWHYCIWFLVVIRLLIPYAPQSTFSIFNLFSIVNNSSNQSINKVPSINKPILIPQIKKNETLPNSQSNEFPQHKIDNEDFKLGLLTAASLIWLLGMLLLSCYIMAGTFRFRLKLYYQQVCQDSDFLSLVSGCKKEIGISKKVAVIYTDLVKTPAICGFLNPMLLFPVGLKNQLCKDELKYILYHEFAHVKRKDLLFNYIMSVLQVLHWFNPILWYTFYRMRQDAEIACDALALSHINVDDSKKYGETVIKLASIIPKKNYAYGMAGIIGHKYQIKRRITMVS
ncbi:MAG TPA: M56 family metallopeptidase, partial [Clostridia bacterium]